MDPLNDIKSHMQTFHCDIHTSNTQASPRQDPLTAPTRGTCHLGAPLTAAHVFLANRRYPATLV